MLLLIQVLIILVLGAILIVVYIDEIRDTRRYRPHARIEEMWLGEERRQTIRVKTDLDATYLHDKKGEPAKKAYIENISEGGAKIQIEEKLEKDAPLSLEIKLPEASRPITVKGRAAWTASTPQEAASGKRTFGVGIRFTYIKPTEKKKLSQFIEKAIPLQ